MNKVDILCDKDHAMLAEFSKRTLAHVTGRSVSSLQMPFIAGYLEANVKKEVEKDRIIIEHASSACEAGACAEDLDVELIFEKTKAVDRNFVSKLAIPSLMVNLQYRDIADIRKKRIHCVGKMVIDVLPGWSATDPLKTGIRRAYSDRDFKQVMTEIFHLYNEETLKLSRSIKFFHPFNAAINLFAETVFDAMEQAAGELVEDCVAHIYAVPSYA